MRPNHEVGAYMSRASPVLRAKPVVETCDCHESVKLSVDPNPVVKRNGEDNTNRFDIASFIDAPPVLLEPQPPQSHLVVAAVDATTNDEKVQVVRRLAPPKHYNYGEYERPTNCPYAFAVFSSSH
ncbi:unnamed protein product [Brassica oleracea]